MSRLDATGDGGSLDFTGTAAQSADIGFTPAVPGNWSPAPTDSGAALDQIAATLGLNRKALQALSTGWLTGGVVTPSGGGTTVDVTAGTGIYVVGTTIKFVQWNAVLGLAVATPEQSFVEVDQDGVVSITLGPNYDTHIVLAVTHSDDGLVIAEVHDVHRNIANFVNQVQQAWTDIIGNKVVSGLAATKSGTALKINVDAGAAYLGGVSNRFVISEQLNATFKKWIRDGVGGWAVLGSGSTVDPDHYDNGSGTQAASPAGQWKADFLFVGREGDVHLVYGEATFAVKTDAEGTGIVGIPDEIDMHGVSIGKVVSQQGSGVIDEILDIRAFIQSTPLGAGGSPTDHGTLAGLAHDDHPQYQLRSEKGAASGYASLDVSSKLTSTQLPAHAASHNAGGTDALAIDAAAGTGSLRTLGTGATQATAGNDSRLSDARTPATHGNSVHTTGVAAGASAPGDSAAEGSSASVARADHRHSREAFGTGAGTVCQGNDSRLSDARTPTAHATSHKNGGSDEVATATAGANAIPKAGAGGTLDKGWVPASLNGFSVGGQYASAQATCTVTLDWNNGNCQAIQLASGGQTFTFANPVSGARYLLRLKQPSSGAAGTVTWPVAVHWPAGTAPTLTVTNSQVDIITFYYDGTSFFASSTLNYAP